MQRLAPHITEARIPDVFYFPVAEWLTAKERILDTLGTRFPNALLAVRSSAQSEDSAECSMAGAFLSKLNVAGKQRAELAAAIDQVQHSMTGNPRDQILVQPMVDDVAVCGVIMTFDMANGAPYYCIDYDDETGRTDVVTAGKGVHKSLYVYRHADDSMIRSPRVAMFLRMARELESICRCTTLDIEFALNKDGQLFVLQARRIALARNWHPVTEKRVKKQLTHVERFVRNRSERRAGILGKRTILAIMSDWNPAEIIGTTPRPLAASLYRELITEDVWHRARAAMGYRSLDTEELMVLINNHPYIDVRNSFNSFLPSQLPAAVGEKIVNGWLDRLENSLEFHDKVEFEVAQTCIDFCFEDDFKTRYPGMLDDAAFDTYRCALTALTRRCLSPAPGNSLDAALQTSSRLECQTALPELPELPESPTPSAYVNLSRAQWRLDQCRELGALSFAIVARHAFIAEALLRSTVRRGALSATRLGEFKRSIRTVTGTLVEEYVSVGKGLLSRAEFLRKHGHLRPGTYEITSLRYDERDDLFLDTLPDTPAAVIPEFTLTGSEQSGINALLTEAGIDVVNADQLLAYAAKAIAGREHTKFVFTRELSDALSLIARWGDAQGLTREDLSYLVWPELAASLTHPVMDDLDKHYLAAIDVARRTMAAAHSFRLAHIICGVRDIYVATPNRSVPNFIGTDKVSGTVVQLEANTPTSINITNRIVCIENADPGFDWIFTKSPSALITCFGGANSHMAVRCAEFGLPAAIGCGDQIYQRITAAGRIELNCAEKILRPLYAG